METRGVTRIKCQAIIIMAQLVSVPDGRKVQTVSVFKYLQWLLQDTIFAFDFLLLPLRNVAIVLRVQWLNTLRNILFDFQNRIVEFRYKGKKDFLREATHPLKVTIAKAVNKIEEETTQFLICHCQMMQNMDANVIISKLPKVIQFHHISRH